MCLIPFLFVKEIYAMQPPPPPLDITKLKTLMAEADIVVVGTVNEVKETKGLIEAIVGVEKLLKGMAAEKIIRIRETYKDNAPEKFSVKSKNNGEPDKIITRAIAGPSTYRGKYKNDSRVILLLQKIEGTEEYKPLGSGTYNKHLCEFLVEDDGLHTLYFQFAEDLKKYAVSEKQFINLISVLAKSDSCK